VEALGVRMSVEIGTHVYVAILTDTGSFHFSNLSPRTFEICRQLLEAGVEPVRVARQVYDNATVQKLKLCGAVLEGLRVDESGQIAALYLDQQMAGAIGATYDDTEGVINQPLTVKEIQAVVFFKQVEGAHYRVSLRSKGEVDIGAVAKEFGGGGHKNAAGCSVDGHIDELRNIFVEKVRRAIDGRPARH
jgi:phosphoesterase RecJ-like protein